MKKINNIMSIGERIPTYTLDEILYNIYDKLDEMRYNFVPVTIFFVDSASTLEFKTKNDLYEYGSQMEKGLAQFEIIRSKEAYRYNQDAECCETAISIVLEEVPEY